MMRLLLVGLLAGACTWPAAGSAATVASTFSAAGTAVKGEQGPCALAVAGSNFGGTVAISSGATLSTFGSGTLTAEKATSGGGPTACGQGAESLRFAVTAVTADASNSGHVTLAVTVSDSEDCPTPVPSAPTATCTPPGTQGRVEIFDVAAAAGALSGDRIEFAIGTHSGTLGPDSTNSDKSKTWADAKVGSTPGASAVDVVAATGTYEEFGSTALGPCVGAVAGTRVALEGAGFAAPTGGGSFQAVAGFGGVANCGKSAAPPGAATFDLVSVPPSEVVPGSAATLYGVVRDASTAGPPTGTPGTLTAFQNGESPSPAAARNFLFTFGAYDAAFGPRNTNAGLSTRAETTIVTYATAPATGGGSGGGGGGTGGGTGGTGGPPVSTETCFVVGAGDILPGGMPFAVVAKSAKRGAFNGHVEYADTTAGIRFRSTSITGMDCAGSTATITGVGIQDGPGRLKKQQVQFTVTVTDNDYPKKNDRRNAQDLFQIQFGTYARGDVLRVGDIDVRTDD